MGYLISTLLDARKLFSLVITMLMSILQDVGSYMGRAYENPNMGYLMSTLIDARTLCSLVISMLISILQDVGTYKGRPYENPTPYNFQTGVNSRFRYRGLEIQ
jgi:hypothetical protein